MLRYFKEKTTRQRRFQTLYSTMRESLYRYSKSKQNCQEKIESCKKSRTKYKKISQRRRFDIAISNI